MAKNTQLEAAIVATFHSGNVVNISQLMGLVQSGNAQFRSTGTPAFRAIVFALEKDGLLKRETEGGVTRFRWNNKPNPWDGLNGADVIAYDDRTCTVYVRLPLQLQRQMDSGGCVCSFCKSNPALNPTWDTLAIPKSGTAWVIHMPDASSFRAHLSNKKRS